MVAVRAAARICPSPATVELRYDVQMVGLKSLLRWLRQEGGFTPAHQAVRPRPVKTSLSATVFTGESDAWVSYLTTTREQRYDSTLRIPVTCDPAADQLLFHGANETSQVLARHLQAAYQTFHATVRNRPFVIRALHRAIFENTSNLAGRITLRVSRTLPCNASREVPLATSLFPSDVHIVLRESVVHEVVQNLSQAGKHLKPEAHLGWCWPLLRRILSQLSFPDCPRDRFVEKIEVTLTSCLLALHALYEGNVGNSSCRTPRADCSSSTWRSGKG
jgi:hypothetical protein